MGGSLSRTHPREACPSKGHCPIEMGFTTREAQEADLRLASTTVGRRRQNQEGGVCSRAGADARVPWRFSMTMSLSRSLKYDSSVPRSSHQRVFQSCGVRRGRGRRSPPSRATHLAFATRLQPPLPRTQYNVIHTHNTLCHTQCHTQCTAPLPVDVHRQARGSCYCCSTRPTHLACLRLHQPSGPAHQFSISWKQRLSLDEGYIRRSGESNHHLAVIRPSC